MPTIYDNIDADLLGGLKDALTATGCRLIIGMTGGVR